MEKERDDARNVYIMMDKAGKTYNIASDTLYSRLVDFPTYIVDRIDDVMKAGQQPTPDRKSAKKITIFGNSDVSIIYNCVIKFTPVNFYQVTFCNLIPNPVIIFNKQVVQI